MKTRARLDSVFQKAFPVPFDDGSKFVFFGDVHRGDDSLSDEFGRNRHIYYHALNYYYQTILLTSRSETGTNYGNIPIMNISDPHMFPCLKC